jgi:hypothetical protein
VKTEVLKRWVEVDTTMLTDKKRTGVEHILFVATCEEVKASKTGKITTRRHKDIRSFRANTEDEADSLVAGFCDREGVTVLDHDTPWTP